MRYLAALCLFVLVTLGLPASADTVEVGGVEVPVQLQVGDQELALNGSGRRTRWMVSLYVASLYVTERTSDAEAIIQAREPKAITLHITSDRINRDNMMEAILEGLESAMDGDTSPIQTHIDDLRKAFDKDISKGDLVELVYQPQQGVSIRHNGDEVGRVAEDDTFRRALFGIWFGDDPVQSSLKRDLLGR